MFLLFIFLLEALRSRPLKPLAPCELFAYQQEHGSPVFPLLEPPETNPNPHRPHVGGDCPVRSELAETFRHSGWQHNRQLVYEALQRTEQPAHRIIGFADCGAYAFVFQSAKAPYEYRLGGSSCRDRFCVPCAKERSRVLANNVLDALGKQPVRFLTLTLRTNDGPLSTQIDRLYSCFAALRNRAFWKKRVNGGCAFTEVKWSDKHSGWNVHIHCMLHGLYIPKSEIWRAWWEITGDSFQVDIKLVHDHRTIGRYVTKYISKPLDNSFLNRQPQFDELIQAMHGRRLCLTFGDWRGVKLTQSPEPGDWINLGGFHDVLMHASEGDQDSLNAIRYICTDRTEELLQTVGLARSPPTEPPHGPTQSRFDWASTWNLY